jgi:hypothetical protein
LETIDNHIIIDIISPLEVRRWAMPFASNTPVMTGIQRQLVVDLDRMATALNSKYIPRTLAIYVTSRHNPNLQEGMLRRLCHDGYLRLRTDDCYELTQTRLPPVKECAVGSHPAELNDNFFTIIATEWQSGNRSVETFFLKVAQEEKSEAPANSPQATAQQIELALCKTCVAVNGGRTPSTPWGVIIADHMLLQRLKGNGLSSRELRRLLEYHDPNLVSPQSRQTTMRNKGLLDMSGSQWQRNSKWFVSKAAEEIIMRLGTQPSLSHDQARAMLSQ